MCLYLGVTQPFDTLVSLLYIFVSYSKTERVFLTLGSVYFMFLFLTLAFNAFTDTWVSLTDIFFRHWL